MEFKEIIKKQTDKREYPIHTVWLVTDQAGFIMNKEKMYSCKEEAEKRIKYLNSPKFSGEARVHVGEYYLITDLQKLKRKLKKKDSHNKNGDKNQDP